MDLREGRLSNEDHARGSQHGLDESSAGWCPCVKGDPARQATNLEVEKACVGYAEVLKLRPRLLFSTQVAVSSSTRSRRLDPTPYTLSQRCLHLSWLSRTPHVYELLFVVSLGAWPAFGPPGCRRLSGHKAIIERFLQHVPFGSSVHRSSHQNRPLCPCCLLKNLSQTPHVPVLYWCSTRDSLLQGEIAVSFTD